jgi:hypothetical protein
VERLTGRRPPRLAVPPALLWLAGLGEEIVERATGRPPRQLTRGAARLLSHDWALDSSRAREALGWSPRSLSALLHDTIEWMQRDGLVPAGTLKGARA